jgi:hypothetical protein
LLLVNLTGGQIGEGDGIGVAVFLTFFFFLVGFFVAFFLVGFFVGSGLTVLFPVGSTVAFLDGLGFELGLGVGVAACALDPSKTRHSDRATSCLTLILYST